METQPEKQPELAPAPEKLDYQAITTEAQFAALLDKLAQADAIGIDTETTSLDAMNAALVGISIAFQAGEAVYIPVGHSLTAAPEQLDLQDVLGRLKPQDSVRLAGFVTAVRTMMGKRGKIAFVSLEDLSGLVEIMVSGHTLENCADYLKSDQVLIIESKVSRDDYGGGDGLRIMANQVMTLQMAPRTLRPAASASPSHPATTSRASPPSSPHTACPTRRTFRCNCRTATAKHRAN